MGLFTNCDARIKINETDKGQEFEPSNESQNKINIKNIQNVFTREVPVRVLKMIKRRDHKILLYIFIL